MSDITFGPVLYGGSYVDPRASKMCCHTMHDHFTTEDDDGNIVDPPVLLNCRDCLRPTHWDETVQDYRHDDPSAPMCFHIRRNDGSPCDWSPIPSLAAIMGVADGQSIPKAQPVKVVKANPVAWRIALKKAGGDPRRLTVDANGRVTIHNRRAR